MSLAPNEPKQLALDSYSESTSEHAQMERCVLMLYLNSVMDNHMAPVSDEKSH
jgi:hypothetical protein